MSATEFLRSRRDDLVEFARELVATPSPNPPGDERAVAALVTAKLHELGVRDVESVGSSKERPNVLARAGGRGRTVVLAGTLTPSRPAISPSGARILTEPRSSTVSSTASAPAT